MPAGAVKLLKDPRWTAAPLHTALSGAGKKTGLVSEPLHRGASAAAHTPGERGVGGRREGGGGEARKESPETLSGRHLKGVVPRRTKSPPGLSSQDTLTAATFLSLALLLICLMRHMSAFYLSVLDKSQQMGSC